MQNIGNLAEVCNQAANNSLIIRKIDFELWLQAEQTKRACVNCFYYSDSGYLPCAVHPDGAGTDQSQLNDCKDWELSPLRVAI